MAREVRARVVPDEQWQVVVVPDTWNAWLVAKSVASDCLNRLTLPRDHAEVARVEVHVWIDGTVTEWDAEAKFVLELTAKEKT